ncbi:uncharacterized protein BDZ83DRAFT_170728 [Colletotrichum acutatum]|uniref:Uncharacterized protein n=1 Tax=Glomerella acutata TaxID=27357 RepID=A0AAD8UQB6_GLOAC|nr:uncharacterized protein BDZ83DRAFT_170728 [Colletotrichum acutatum]KAK1728031.1 hypothetical protein BDZ83DRAFT_170728 [Colletotrichum acutatum]
MLVSWCLLFPHRRRPISLLSASHFIVHSWVPQYYSLLQRKTSLSLSVSLSLFLSLFQPHSLNYTTLIHCAFSPRPALTNSAWPGGAACELESYQKKKETSTGLITTDDNASSAHPYSFPPHLSSYLRCLPYLTPHLSCSLPLSRPLSLSHLALPYITYLHFLTSPDLRTHAHAHYTYARPGPLGPRPPTWTWTGPGPLTCTGTCNLSCVPPPSSIRT